MEPRADKIKKARMEKRSKLFKAFSASTALSSMILGGAQLASPTYAQFNDKVETEIEVGACFIFPKVIEQDYREKSVKLSEEAVKVAEAALEEGDKLKAEKAASFSMDAFDAGGEEGSSVDSGGSDAGGGADMGLASEVAALGNQKGQLERRLKSVNSHIKGMEKAQQDLEEYSQKVGTYIETLTQTKVVGDEKLKEINVLLDEMIDQNKEEMLFEEIKDKSRFNIRSRAKDECDYKDDFFDGKILPGMNEAINSLNNILSKVNTEESNFKDILDNNDEALKNIKDKLEKYKDEEAIIKSEISSLKKQIKAAKEKAAQEKAAKEKAEKEQADKKNEQTPPAAKPDAGKPDAADPAAKPDDKAKPHDQQTTPPADGKKDDSSAGDQKDAGADKPADNGKPADTQPDAGAGSDVRKDNTTDADQDTDASQASDASADGSDDSAQ